MVMTTIIQEYYIMIRFKVVFNIFIKVMVVSTILWLGSPYNACDHHIMVDIIIYVCNNSMCFSSFGMHFRVTSKIVLYFYNNIINLLYGRTDGHTYTKVVINYFYSAKHFQILIFFLSHKISKQTFNTPLSLRWFWV